MASVQWVGDFRTRTISASEWNRVGAPGPTVTWNAENGWSIPESAFTPEQLTILENMSGFWTGQPDGPRPYPPAVNMGSTREQYESLYYREVKEIYEAILAMPPVALDPVVAMGQTQAEARAAIGAVDEAAVTAAVAAVVDGSPGALDTLNELAIALGNDADFAATVTNSLMGKVDRVSTPNQIYIVDATGNQATGTYNNAATPSTFVRRDANSRAQFADPAVAADATNKGYVDTADAAKLDKTVTANQVYATDAGGEQISLPAGTVGKSLLATNDPVDARTAIGAGTSNLALGTTGTTAKPGNYQPAWNDITAKPAVIAAGADQVTARSAIAASGITEGVAPTWIETTDKQARPTRPSVVAIGDSITDSNYSATVWSGNSYSRTSSYLSMGYLNCAMVWNRQPATWFEVGINGQTSAQGLARFDTDVTPLLPQVVVESFATNDIFTNRTAAAVFADKLNMWRKAWAFGAKVIAANCPPRDTFTSGQKQEAHKLNEMLRKFAATNPTDFVLVDWYSVLADPLTGNYKTGYAADGVHPLTMASWAMGKAYEAALDQFIPGGVTNLATGADDVGNIAAGPLMTGSSGLIIANKGLTGTLASGWYAGSTGADTTLTSSLSNVTRSDGYGNWQQINTTVTPGVNDTVTINQDVTTGWAVGDVVQACIEFETDAPGWTNGKFDLNLLAVDGSDVCYSIAGSFQPGETDVIVKFRPEQGILQTAPIIIPELTTKLQLRVSVGGLGIARFGRAAIRKLDTA